MFRLLLSALVLVLATGCPDYATIDYRVDVKAKRITILAHDLRTDDAADADQDFATVADSVAHPDEDEGITDVHAEMFEDHGVLTVRWEGTFTDLSAIDVYKHDRKSPFIWCVDTPDRTEVTSKTGTVPEELPGCVVFDRKAKVLEFTVRNLDLEGTASLLPQFRATQDQD